MKKIAWLLIATLCSAMALVAQDKSSADKKANDMIGWVCNAKCVDQSSGTPSCRQNCSETTGEVVFIQDNGQISKIVNQKMVQPMTGKKCKIKATRDQDSGMIAVQNIIEYGG
jgi:hypothetical protein